MYDRCTTGVLQVCYRCRSSCVGGAGEIHFHIHSAGVQVFRYAGMQVCRCAGVQVQVQTSGQSSGPQTASLVESGDLDSWGVELSDTDR